MDKNEFPVHIPITISLSASTRMRLRELSSVEYDYFTDKLSAALVRALDNTGGMTVDEHVLALVNRAKLSKHS